MNIRRTGKLILISFSCLIIVTGCKSDRQAIPDNTVTTSNPNDANDSGNYNSNTKNDNSQVMDVTSLSDGKYKAKVTLEGGTGKATVDEDVMIVVADGKANATITWSSVNYDYMIVDDEKYLNESEAGEQSSFTIPVSAIGTAIPVIGDTTAMSVPHEIEYTLLFELVDND